MNSEENNEGNKVIEKYPFSCFEVNEDGHLVVELKDSNEKFYWNRVTNEWT